MGNTIKVTSTKHLGLDVYRVWHNETLLHEYMSYAAAWTAAKRLEAKLFKAAK